MSKNLKNAIEITLFVHILGWFAMGVASLIMSFVLWKIIIPDLVFIRFIEANIIILCITLCIGTYEIDI